MKIYYIQVKHHLILILFIPNIDTLHNRYGLLATLISDNGKQFDSHNFTKFCPNLGIKQQFTSIEHPQSSRQAELANRILLGGLKK